MKTPACFRATVLLALGLALGLPAAERGVEVLEAEESLSLPTYHALIIGINDYKQWPSLLQPADDAQRLRKLLKEGYGFEDVRLLLNEEATRKRIISELEHLLEFDENHAVFIYFAGHGTINRRLQEGYWIPVDAALDSPADYVPNIMILQYVRQLKARHVLIVSDACFSGTMLRGAGDGEASLTNPADVAWYRRMLARPARFVISSGDLETVPDQSVFSAKLLNTLQYEESQYVSAKELALKLEKEVPQFSRQTVLSGRLRNDPNDEGGQFIFVRRKDTGPRRTAPLAKADSQGMDPQFFTFLGAKRKQAERMAVALKLDVAEEIWDFFDAGQRGDWAVFTNVYAQLRLRRGHDDGNKPDELVQNEMWQLVNECFGTYEQFTLWDNQWLHLLAEDIVRSIPAKSIYFGGTDPGRYLITAFCKAHAEGNPFFTITQNALADDTSYLSYLRAMYGRRLSLPTTEDAQKCFQEYVEDARRRMRMNPPQLKPGEDVKLVGDRVQVVGQVAVMQINGLLAKLIFERNTNREFFLEESFPLDWMYPHLTPFGSIMKLNRRPPPELSESLVKQDRDYWTKYCDQLVGTWLSHSTSVEELCAFVEKVHRRRDFTGFTGDHRFIRNAQAQKTFSKLRSSIAGVYTWREKNAQSSVERTRMHREADFAYRQALALCPYSPEAVYRYVTLLSSDHRINEALLILQTAAKLESSDSDREFFAKTIQQLQQFAVENPTLPVPVREMEKQYREKPDDLGNALKLAMAYYGSQHTNLALQVLDQIVRHPKADAPTILAIADFQAKASDVVRLEKALEKLVHITPEAPEAWYDLAAIRATLQENSAAVQALTKAMRLSAQRLARDRQAKDLKVQLRNDKRFQALRAVPEFKAAGLE